MRVHLIKKRKKTLHLREVQLGQQKKKTRVVTLIPSRASWLEKSRPLFFLISKAPSTSLRHSSPPASSKRGVKVTCKKSWVRKRGTSRVHYLIRSSNKKALRKFPQSKKLLPGQSHRSHRHLRMSRLKVRDRLRKCKKTPRYLSESSIQCTRNLRLLQLLRIQTLNSLLKSKRCLKYHKYNIHQ